MLRAPAFSLTRPMVMAQELRRQAGGQTPSSVAAVQRGILLVRDAVKAAWR